MTSSYSQRAVLHMDLDTFYVSVERRRNTKLIGKPLIIGANQERAVVATASYEARQYGVHSAMPMKMARQLCPDAIIINGDMEEYSKWSHIVTDIVREEAPVFEKASIDEFYIDLSGMERFFGTYRWASALRQKVMHETHLPMSMGLATNKLVSKVATGEAKPNGERQVAEGNEKGFLAPLPIDKIPMIGPKKTRLLNDMGIYNVHTLSEMPLELLRHTFGATGVELWKRANGIDNTPVMPYQEQKSISTESTFEEDTIDVRHLRAVLIAMVEKVACTLRKKQRLTACITVKIRYANFDTETKQMRIPYSSSDHALVPYALQLFEKLYTRRMRIRLIGVRLSHLVHGLHQISLFDETEEQVKLCQALDQIKFKYGHAAIRRAVTMGAMEAVRQSDFAHVA